MLFSGLLARVARLSTIKPSSSCEFISQPQRLSARPTKLTATISPSSLPYTPPCYSTVQQRQQQPTLEEQQRIEDNYNGEIRLAPTPRNVRASYRHLLRKQARTFDGDEGTLGIASSKLKEGYLLNATATSNELPNLLEQAYQVGSFLEHGIVQGILGQRPDTGEQAVSIPRLDPTFGDDERTLDLERIDDDLIKREKKKFKDSLKADLVAKANEKAKQEAADLANKKST